MLKAVFGFQHQIILLILFLAFLLDQQQVNMIYHKTDEEESLELSKEFSEARLGEQTKRDKDW